MHFEKWFDWFWITFAFILQRRGGQLLWLLRSFGRGWMSRCRHLSHAGTATGRVGNERWKTNKSGHKPEMNSNMTLGAISCKQCLPDANSSFCKTGRLFQMHFHDFHLFQGSKLIEKVEPAFIFHLFNFRSYDASLRDKMWHFAWHFLDVSGNLEEPDCPQRGGGWW